MHAAGADHPDVIAYLADHGADLNARDQFGDTPLMAACAKGNAASATLLIERGADASLRDQEGRTAKERSAPEAEPCLRLPK
jgi:ankyrin repeat protein